MAETNSKQPPLIYSEQTWAITLENTVQRGKSENAEAKTPRIIASWQHSTYTTPKGIEKKFTGNVAFVLPV